MNEQELVDQMLAMEASNNPSDPVQSTDPVDPATNAVSPETADAVPATEGAPTETTQAAALNTTETTEGKKLASEPSKVDEPINLEDTFTKDNRAFAEMRIKQKQQDELLMRFAQMANINVASPDEAFSKLSGIVTEQEAKSKDLDPIILKTIQDQSARLEAYEQEEIKKEANASFIELQKKFNLSNKELESFGKQLSAEGVNPFAVRGVNLSQHYLSMNYQKLIDRAREQGRAEEIERQKRVSKSTIPGQSTGQATANPQGPTLPPRGNGFDDFAKLLGIK